MGGSDEDDEEEEEVVDGAGRGRNGGSKRSKRPPFDFEHVERRCGAERGACGESAARDRCMTSARPSQT